MKSFIISDTNIIVLLCCSGVDKFIFQKNDHFFLYVTSRVVGEIEDWDKPNGAKKLKFAKNDMFEYILRVAKNEKYDPLIENSKEFDDFFNKLLELKDRLVKVEMIKGCSDVDLYLLALSLCKDFVLATQEKDLSTFAKSSKLAVKKDASLCTFEDIVLEGNKCGLVPDEDFLAIRDNLKEYGEGIKNSKLEIFLEREKEIIAFRCQTDSKDEN